MLFGLPSITASELVLVLTTEVEPKIRDMLGVGDTPISKLPQRVKDYCDEWTKTVKQVLVTLANKYSLNVCGNCLGASSSEFLLDIVWCSGNSPCHRIVLACESEWGYAEAVSRDFQKLLVVKAPQKLLIYTGKNPIGEQVRARVKQDMERYPYHIEGEEYILLGLDWGMADARHYVVRSNGPHAGIEFDSLAIARSVSA